MNRTFILLLVSLCSFPTLAKASEDLFTKGYQLICAKQYQAAITVLQPLAEQDHADAQYWLGLSYRLGRPDQDFTDMESELRWYREAAKNGNPYALWRLGQGEYLSCQLFGSCEYMDEEFVKKAQEIWRQRAEQGDGEAMYQVGVRALGWRQLIPFYNAYTRIEWMKKAIKHGYPKAVAELYFMHEKLWGDEHERIAWLRIAAEKGDPWAQNMMGKFADSPEERLSWNQKSVAQGYSEGIFSLAFSYENGRDVEKDLTKAAFYYCILQRHSGARDACVDMGNKLSAQEREMISIQVKEWLEQNTVYYFTDPLFD